MSGGDARSAVRPGEPTWIEASAGTGKTWTLERIVVDRVRQGAPIESILVVTFTEKATREMRSRVRATLDAEATAAAARGESEPAALLSAAVLSFDRATIATLHGFCRRTLREHAFLSGRALDEDHAGGPALAGAVFRRWLRAQLDGPGPHAELLRVALEWMRPGELEALALKQSVDHTPFEPRLSREELAAALAVIPRGDALEAVIPELSERAGTHPGTRARVGAALRGLDAARAAGGDVVPALLRWGRAPGSGARGEEGDAAWLAARLKGHAGLAGPLAVIARSVMTPLPALCTLAFPDLALELARHKQRAQIVDFDDLISGLAMALKSARGPALIHALRAQYTHVLVDEFQDTDPLQWSILRTLFLDCSAGGSPERTFVLIGDPKQAIYGFRGADVHTYREAKREVLERGRFAALDVSYRAGPALLDALHHILMPVEGAPPFFTRAGTYDAEVRAGDERRVAVQGERSEPLPPVTVLAVAGDPPLRLRPARRAVARAVAEEARRLLSSDVRVGSAPALRRLTASDIFVLTRSQAEGLEVAEALARAGVPYAFFKQDGLFATAEARDYADVLSALTAPDDPGLRARALATPFFAVAAEDFVHLEALPFEHPMLARFRALVSAAEQHDVASLLADIVRTTGITRRELYLFRSERRLTNYLHLSEALTQLAIEHRCGPRELSMRLRALVEGRATAGEDQDVQRIESERAAVQLLTMHKSKGLEAEVVFVVGGLGVPRRGRGERRVGTRDGRRVAWLLPESDGPSDAALESSIADEEREESERLLYVAMTRARSLLYLPLYLADAPASPRVRGPYRVVQERLAALHRSGALTAPGFSVLDVPLTVPSTRGGPRREVLAPPESMPRLEEVQAPAELFARLRDAMPQPVVTSYSRLKAEAQRRDVRGSSIESDAIERYHELDVEVRSAPSPEDPGGTGFGVAVHLALEKVPVSLVRVATDAASLARIPEVAALYDVALADAGVDARARPLLETMVFAGLRTEVPVEGGTLADLARPERRAAEVPFLFPIPERSHPPLWTPRGGDAPRLSVERGLVRGVMDLLFVEQGLTYVVDWKTDRLDGYEPRALAAHVAASYDLQVRLYALALARMVGGFDRFGGLLYVFLRGLSAAPSASLGGAPLFGAPGLVFVRPTRGELAAWDEELRAQGLAAWAAPASGGAR